MRRKEMKRRGQTLVEMALILPILILILLGLIEFGRALFIYTVVSNAAREGARHGIVLPLDGPGIEQAVYDRLVLVPTDTVEILTSIQFPPDPPDLYTPGKSRIVVTVNYQFQMITPFMAQIFPPTELSFTSGRTIQGGTRIRATIIPGPPPPPGEITPATPMTWAPTRTPTDRGMVATATPTDTPLYTPTEGPAPTPQALHVSYVDGYPCRGTDQNQNRGRIRIEVIVKDEGGAPVTDAVVVEDVEGTTLVHTSGGHYGASGGCWESARNSYGDRYVRVSASKTGFTGDSAYGNTAGKICNSCGAGLVTATPTPTSSTPTPPTPTQGTPTPSLSPTPVTPTATPSLSPTPTITPTPLPLVVTYELNYPARGTDGPGGSKGAIRVKVRVTSGGIPVTGANVTVDVESGTLTDMGNGYYGGGSGCWVSSQITYQDRSVTVTAVKAGYQTGSVTASTDSNPHGTTCP